MPAKTSNKQKSLAGTLRPCRKNNAEGRTVVGVDIDAAALSPTARKVLPQFLNTVSPTGRLTADNAPAFVRMVETFAEILDASEAIKAAGGPYYSTTNEKTGSVMPRVHPAVAVRAAADKRFQNYAAMFGMTPDSRLRATAATPDQKPADDSWLTI